MTESELRALFEEAVTHQAKGQLPEAIEKFTKVVIEKPDFPQAWNSRGAALQKLGHPFDAILNYDKACQHDPNSAIPFNNRGTAYCDLEMYDRAIEDYERAIGYDPDCGVSYNNKGNALVRLARIKEGAAAYAEGVRRDPKDVSCHFGLSLTLLQLGQFEEGWKEFEWRWKTDQLPSRGLPFPDWDGNKANSPDDVLLIYGEQGNGDVLQFMRYAPLAKKLGWKGKVYVEVRHPLTRLIKTLDGIDGVITMGEKPPEGTVCVAAVMSIPLLLWKHYKDIPAETQYLHADKYLSGLWADRLKAMPTGMLVGVCWAGQNRESSPHLQSIDKRRSMALSDFAAAAKVPGVSWVSLQVGPPNAQVKAPPLGMTIGNWVDDLYDYHDTAALISCLDLVITVDTSVAHLAGALGKPVWMLSRFDSCWRWGIDREDTPWYPNMKIYNQKEPYNWADVIDRLASDLSKEVLTHLRGRLALVASN